jgi:predicted amidophosphoribosyltransferase
MTTGHTANELAGVLRRAGVRFIEVWVVARAGE